MEMMDIVAQKTPSEDDVNVARSFLTKILRSSMRRNQPISRPHSWHSTKFNENQSETAKPQAPPTQVWHTIHDASSSSDLSSSWDQTPPLRVSDQFSSHGSMDSLDQPPPLWPAFPPNQQHGGASGGQARLGIQLLPHQLWDA
ncbi:hypothetical protein CesoFtcFv8_005692 [Champsocephalus esox]|uniref:Uncharacterized protein n=1 Tax=Champsocephalus esox TaxID=159716 RepID=A0AAN8CQ91_9TELE|nr:hypothetical protein CesoFtcFv8_005692 [Champsocephalus esox]